MIYVKEINPTKATFYDALDLQETKTFGFSQSLVYKYWAGPDWKPTSLLELRQSITDPRERLKCFLWESKKHVLIRKYEAAVLMVSFLTTPGGIWYAAMEKDDETGVERMVGMASWFLPEHMAEVQDRKSGKCGVIFKIKTFFKVWGYKMYQWYIRFRLRSLEMPLSNPRRDRFWKHVRGTFHESDSTVEELSEMSKDEIAQSQYPSKSAVMFGLIAVMPNQQRKGIGQKLMEYALDDIPVVPTPFSHNGKTSYGPQKIILYGTDEGKGLYSKYGFKALIPCHYVDGEVELNMTYMSLTR